MFCRCCSIWPKVFKTSTHHESFQIKDQSRVNETERLQSGILHCVCDQTSGVKIFCEDHRDMICQACAIAKHSKCETVNKGDNGSPCSVKPQSKSANYKADKPHPERNSELNERLSIIEDSEIDIQALKLDSNTIITGLETDVVKELETSDARSKPEIKHNLLTSDSKLYIFETGIDPADSDMKTSKATMIRENVSRALGIDYKKSLNRNHVSFQQTKVESRKAINIQMRRDPMISNITGYAFLPDSRVLLCDNTNDKVKVLTSSFELAGSVGLKDSPCDIALLNESTAVVTLPGKMQMQYLKFNPKLKKKHVVKLDKPCWGIDIVEEDIYITCHHICGGNGEVRVLDFKGKCKHRINVQEDGSDLFVQPNYLAVSPSSKYIYVSDVKTSIITCLRSDGSVIYRYRDEGFTAPGGICVDTEDNAIVVSEGANTVQVITPDGLKQQNLLTMQDGLNAPQSVGYRTTDNTLFIGCFLNTWSWVIKLTN